MVYKRYISLLIAIIMLSILSPLAFGQKKGQDVITVESEIKDAQGKPVRNAVIFGKDGAVKAVSDANGRFSIKVPAETNLLIEAPGFHKKVILSSVNPPAVLLDRAAFLMEETDEIFVPFGKIRKKEVANAVTFIDPKELDAYDNTQNVYDAIRARVPGLLGATNIRGIGQALIVVDGIPRDASNLNLVEIDQITVLKDANATMLYGVQAQNGVIFITTKRGEAFKRKINFSAEKGISNPVIMPKYLRAAESMKLYNEALTNDGQPKAYTDADIANYANGTNPARYPDVDYYSDEFLRSGKPFSRFIGEFSGGNNVAQYYTSVGWNHSESLYKLGNSKNSSADRFNIRANVNFRVNDFIKSTLGAVVILDKQNAPLGNFWNDAAVLQNNFFPQLIPVSLIKKNAIMQNGADLNEAKRVNDQFILGGTSQYRSNIYGNMLFAGYDQSMQRTAQFNNGIDVDLGKILEGLTFKTFLSFDVYNSYNQTVSNQYAVYQPTWETNAGGTDSISSLNRIGVDLSTGVQNLGNASYLRRLGTYATMDYNRTFNEVHSFKGTLLAYYDKIEEEGITIDEAHAHLGLRAAYAYKNRYFVDFSSAYVNGYRLQKGNRGGFSPSLGLAWVVKEDMTQTVNYLKLKASAGIINTDINSSNYRLYESTLSQGFYINWFDGARTNRETLINRSANPNLTFEKMQNVNVGMEGYFFNRSLYVEANLFASKNAGLVTQRSIYPAYVANFIPYENYNANSYKGAELGLIWTKSLAAFTVNMGVNLLYSTSKVSQRDELWQNSYQFRQGGPVDAIFGLEATGFFADSADIQNSPRQAFGEVRRGDLKYKDQNGDGIVDQNDEIRIGNSQARLSYGIHFTVKYKNLSLFAIGNGQRGSDRIFSGAYFWVQGNNKYSQEVSGRWTPETASTATYPRLSSRNSPNNFRNSTFWLYNNNLFNLSRVQLSYDLPGSMTRNWTVKNIGFYARAMNLAIISKYADKQQLRIGAEPSYRSYALGFKLMF